MSGGQTFDAKVQGAAEDPRVTLVGRTMVCSDRQGPYRFVREGVEVPCVCDPEHGVQFAYHQGHHGPYRLVFGK
jgi:hypothetical protein